MSTLRGRTPQDTFGGLLRVEAGGLISTLQPIEDGFGQVSPLKLSMQAFAIHNLTFPSTGATPGKFLAVGQDGTSMVWVDASGEPSTPTAKGTIRVSDGSSNVDLDIGTNGQVLMADSTKPTGVKWATIPSSGGSSDAIPDSTSFQYNDENKISIMTENIGADQRVTNYDYNSDGTIHTISIAYQGVTRLETYTYVDGQVSTMTSTYI
jgi:hypothetical protein